MFSRNSQKVTVKSSLQKKYQTEIGIKYRYERNQYSELILLPYIQLNNNNDNDIERYFKNLIKKEIKPIILSLSSLINNNNKNRKSPPPPLQLLESLQTSQSHISLPPQSQEQKEDYINNNNNNELLYIEINSFNKIINKFNDIFNEILNQYSNSSHDNYLIIKSVFKSVLTKSLFKKTILYNKDQFNKLKSPTKINFPLDWNNKNNDYQFILPLNSFLYLINKLDLHNNFKKLIIINYNSNNNSTIPSPSLLLSDPITQFIKSILVNSENSNNNNNNININIINALFNLIFATTSIIDQNLNNKIMVLEYIINSIINNQIIVSTSNDKLFQFQFIISFLNTLIELSDFISSISPTSSTSSSSSSSLNIDKLIYFLESFYNLVFIKWEKCIFQLYPIKLFINRIIKLHSILNNRKFQNGLIGILNFNLYSLINQYNNSISNNNKNNINNNNINNIKMINDNNLNNSFKIFNYYNFLNYFSDDDNNNNEINHINNTFNKILIIFNKYLNNIQKDNNSNNIIEYFKQIKQFINLIIAIPFHLDKVSYLLDSQIENYFLIWHKDLLPIVINLFNNQLFNNIVNKHYSSSSSSSSSSFPSFSSSGLVLFDEIKNLVYLILYLSKYYKPKLKNENYILVLHHLIGWFLIFALPLLSNQYLLIDFKQQLIQLDSDLIQQVKDYIKIEKSLPSIQLLLNKSLNQLTISINNQQQKEENQDLNTQEQQSSLSPIIDNELVGNFDSQENELKVLENLKLISFLDLPLLLNRILKSVLKNKGQSRFFIELLLNKLFIPIDSLFNSILDLFLGLESNEGFGSGGIFSNDLTVFNFKSFFSLILDHISINNNNSNNSNNNNISNEIIVFNSINYISNLNIIVSKFLSPFLLNLKDQLVQEPNQLILFFEILIVFLNQLNSTSNNISNNNSLIIKEINNQKVLLKEFFLNFIEIINYQFINFNQQSAIFLELFYNILNSFIGYLNSDNDKTIDLETILNNIRFYNLDWKLQFRIYSLLKESQKEDSLFELKLKELISLESVWDNNSSKSDNNLCIINRVEELFQISNLFEFCFISENYLNQIIGSLVNNCSDILFLDNKLKFKKLILVCLINKLPTSPSYYYKYLINHILPALYNSNLIDKNLQQQQEEQQQEIQNEKALFLYEILKSYFRFNSLITLNNNNNNQNSTQLMYFLKQISNLYQDLLTSNKQEDEKEDQLLFNLKILLKSIKVLLSFNYFKQFELFFIISLNLLSAYEINRQVSTQKDLISNQIGNDSSSIPLPSLQIESCKCILLKSINILNQDKQLNSEDTQIINDKLNTLLLLLNKIK